MAIKSPLRVFRDISEARTCLVKSIMGSNSEKKMIELASLDWVRGVVL